MKKSLLLLVVALTLAACGSAAPTDTAPPDTGVGLANPASVYCAENGYELVFTDDGSTGMCKFPDGSECEEWAFFRGECGQTFSYCETHDGSLEVLNGIATCVFADGSTCVESDYFTEVCKPGDNPG